MIRVHDESSYTGNSLFMEQNWQHFSSICLRYLESNKHIKNLRKGYLHHCSCLFSIHLFFQTTISSLYHAIAFCFTNIPLHCMCLVPQYVPLIFEGTLTILPSRLGPIPYGLYSHPHNTDRCINLQLHTIFQQQR